MTTGPDPFDFGGPSRSPVPTYGSGGATGPSVPTGPSSYGASGVPAPGSAAPSPAPSPPPSADDLIGRPPVLWLLLALAGGLTAATLAGLAGSDVLVAGLAWALAGPVGISLVALHHRADLDQRARPVYDCPSWAGALRWGAGLALAAGIAVSAWRIAEWAGHA